MSTLSALGARALPTPAFPAATQQYGKTGRSQTAAATGSGSSTGDGSVSLSDDSILQNRAATLGSATVDYAQNLLSSFTQQVFGDASKGETVSFDSISLDTSSAFAESAQQTSGANGSSSAAAGLSDSAHFIGKGTITTADGRSFDFEVEVQYNDKIEVGASQGNPDGSDTSGAAAPDASGDSLATALGQGGAQSAGGAGAPASTSSGTGGLPTVQLPDLNFDGGLADLFQLIGRQIQSGSSSADSGASDASGSGNSASTSATDPFKALSLRLLKLVDAGSDSDLYTPSTPASSAANAKSLANTYGAPATTTSGATATTPASNAPATTPVAAAGTNDTSAASTAAPAATTTPATASA